MHYYYWGVLVPRYQCWTQNRDISNDIEALSTKVNKLLLRYYPHPPRVPKFHLTLWQNHSKSPIVKSVGNHLHFYFFKTNASRRRGVDEFTKNKDTFTMAPLIFYQLITTPYISEIMFNIVKTLSKSSICEPVGRGCQWSHSQGSYPARNTSKNPSAHSIMCTKTCLWGCT
jgi:hypothetical protein